MVEQQTPFMAPGVPGGYVEREQSRLVGLLLNEQRENPVVVCGAGGTGKTALAAAVCHDDAIIAAFDGGILWASLGEDPDIADELSRLASGLTGEQPVFIDVENAARSLADRLAGKNLLIVLDDVWDAAHVSPFLVGGESCAHLITTRDDQIARDLNAEMIEVDLLDLAEAERVVQYSELRPLVERLGGWPVLVAVAGSIARETLRQGGSIETLLAQFNAATDDVGSPDLPSVNSVKFNRITWSLITIGLALGEETAHDAYRAIAIFPPNMIIPVHVLARLWSMSEDGARELCMRLASLSLLNFDRDAGAVWLPRVIRSALLSQVDDPAAIHAQLLERYNPHDELSWHEIEDDGYLYDHLIMHLWGAGQADAALALLTESPDWMNARHAAASSCAGYAADLRRMIKHYSDPVDAEAVVPLVALNTALQVVRAYVMAYTVEDLTILARLGEVPHARTIARLYHDPAERYAALRAIRDVAGDSGELLDELLMTAQSIADSFERHRALSELVPVLARADRAAEAESILDGLYAAVESFGSEEGRSMAQRAIARALAALGRFDAARDRVDAIPNGRIQLDAQCDLVMALIRERRFAEAQELTANLVLTTGDWTKIQYMMVLSQAAAQDFDATLATAQKIEIGVERARALYELALATIQGHAFDRAHAVIPTIADPALRAEAYGALGAAEAADDRDPVPSLNMAVEQVKVIRDPAARYRAMALLAAQFDQAGQVSTAGRLFDFVVERVKVAGDPQVQMAAHTALAHAYAALNRKNDAMRALAEARRVRLHDHSDGGLRAEALSLLAQRLSQVRAYEAADRVFERTLNAAFSIEKVVPRLHALLDVMGALIQAGRRSDVEALIGDVYKNARTLHDPQARMRILGRMVGVLVVGRWDSAASVLEDAIHSAKSGMLPGENAQNLRDLAIILVEAQCARQAMTVLKAIPRMQERTQVLSIMAWQAARESKFDHASEYLTTAAEIFEAIPGFTGLPNTILHAQVAYHAYQGRFVEADATAAKIQNDPAAFMDALSDIARARAQRGDVAMAVEVLAAISDPARRQDALIELAHQLVRRKHVRGALDHLRACSLDDMVQTLIGWLVVFDRIESGLALDVVRTVTRIAGWLDTDWRRVHDLIGSG